ncbi:hypothetical protein FCL40_13545 [Ferrimonas sediminicola]|uniref:Cytochrome c domain-containing protein n=1 Tax=Ferrimonas sediminicola TaxID=2569538 RepID=A0A4U1BBA9_9GAMM|nr:hypothetical protein [Ferrimonas sediminicola]TKB48148.1 hypothetical protein FCL40_13545 [Ferrimonas sediminicola]
MKMFSTTLFMTLLLCQGASAHPIFADTMKRQLKLYRVECTACHSKGEQYQLRNGLGLRFEAELPESLTWQYHSVLAMGNPEAIRSHERAMAKRFSLILLKLGREPIGDRSLTELLLSGDMQGVHPAR